MLQYILQVIFFQLGFLLVYEILLKKETFFSYNRWYLLVTPVIALLLPFLKFQRLSSLVPAESIVMLPKVFIGGNSQDISAVTAAPVEAGFQLNWWLILYSAGAVFSLFLFFKKYYNLKKLFKNRIISEEKEIKIIEVPQSKLACTFYRTIFLGEYLSESEKEHILPHELVHVHQKHSLDLLFFELLKIIFWFNPLIYLYQSKIAGLHEYIADAQVVKSTGKQNYFQQLLNTAFNTENISFINQFFNHSLIKKRIVMLQKSQSKSISKIKYLVLVPLMLVMLTYVACSEEKPFAAPVEKEASEAEKLEQIQAIVNDGTEITTEDVAKIKQILNSSDVSGLTDYMEDTRTEVEVQKSATQITDVPFAIIEEVPVYPGCEGLTNEARKECMQKKITGYVAENFDSGLGKELGLKGVNRIYVQFRINKEGGIDVLGVRGPHPELEAEARRVIEGLPEMTPGKQDGKAVGVLYSLPIHLKVGE